ncbi:replication factor A protein 2 [Gryganskiella cystojenkinii]|nr:replication factor A protein 2 [Gryganskiella cystojenkinii]
MSNYRPYSNAGQGAGFVQDSFASDSATPVKVRDYDKFSAAGNEGSVLIRRQLYRSDCHCAIGRTTHHSLRPVTIKQLLAASQTFTDGDFKLDGHELNQVTFIAAVRTIDAQSTQTGYTMEDGTGVMDVRKFANDDEDPAEQASITAGAYVRVVGSYREFQNRFTVTAFSIRLIHDMNELTYHNLEVMVVHAGFTRTKIVGAAGSQSSAPTNGMASAGSVSTNSFGKTIDDQINEFVVAHPDCKTGGVHRQEIVNNFAAQLGGIQGANKKIDFLIENGFLYTANDEDHLMSASVDF